MPHRRGYRPDSLLRLVRSVPSPKAEPIKRWLVKVDYERMPEMADPALCRTGRVRPGNNTAEEQLRGIWADPSTHKGLLNALADAATDLGSPERIRDTFVGFQRLLYARI